jgi:hypothetical protein
MLVSMTTLSLFDLSFLWKALLRRLLFGSGDSEDMFLLMVRAEFVAALFNDFIGLAIRGDLMPELQSGSPSREGGLDINPNKK